MIGILNEKPSQMRNFASALGGSSGKYNGEDYKLVAARGHLYEYAKNPEEQVSPALASHYKAWNLANLPWNEQDFLWKRQKKEGVSATLKQIKDILATCDEICIATDDDPTGEGELIAWEIFDELKLRPKKWSRMYFTDEAPSSIQAAFKARKVIPSMAQDMDFVKAQYRSQWDYLSMQFTRIATKFGDGRTLLRQGRLKSAMVLIVGDGLKAASEYKKIPFYENRFRDENQNVFSSKDEPNYPDKTKVPQIYKPSPVVVDSREQKSSPPPRLIDLSTLSSLLAGKGVKAQQVLDVYQRMYEAQIVSYPRTEDKHITPEQFDQLLPKVDEIACLVGIDPKLLTHRTQRSTHVKTGCAHGANRPGLNVPKSLSDLNQYGVCAVAIYTLLARNFLAMLAENYEYEFQKGHLTAYPKFLGTASVPKKQGYKAIFADLDDDDVTSKGLGTMATPFVYEGFPPKPPAPTMRWLMKQLEKYEVGTGATRTSTYAMITTASPSALMAETKGKLSLTDCGNMSYALLPGTNIGNLKMTEQVMAEMKAISQGKANPADGLHRIRQMVREDIETMKNNNAIARKEGILKMSNPETTGQDTASQAPQKPKATGIWKGKEISFTSEYCGRPFTDSEIKRLLAGEEIEITGLVSSKGNSYGVKGKLEKQEYSGHKFIGFKSAGFLNVAGGVPSSWCGHAFTDDEKAALQKGESVELSGCVSSKGNVFSCSVTYGDTDRGGKGIVPNFNK